MGLGSEMQTLVKTLVQGKFEGSLETLADTNFWDPGETLQIQKLRVSESLARPSSGSKKEEVKNTGESLCFMVRGGKGEALSNWGYLGVP